MANPDWGTKHTCQSCGAKYYDLNRNPVVCPKCGTAFNPDALLRSRRSRPASPPKAVAAVVAPKLKPSADADKKLEVADAELEVADDDDEIAALAKVDDDDKLIEDTSDLGEDDDDVAEVVVSGDDKEET